MLSVQHMQSGLDLVRILTMPRPLTPTQRRGYLALPQWTGDL
uniref:Uncharacterized protein n=1 Tax=Anguilla anguilla TaxID=7936 RepID=A0A0E9THJ1_ANGAN